MLSFLAFGLPAAPEWTVIGVLALVLFGPKKLPEMARLCAKVVAEFQKAKEELHREILQIPKLPEIREPLEKKKYQPQQTNSKSSEMVEEPSTQLPSASEEFCKNTSSE